MSISTIVTLVVIALLLFGLIAVYNRLVTLRNRFQNAFAQIEVQLKRRYDLIPNLVEVAKGYLKHERETLEAVIQARNQALGALQAAAKDPGSAAAMQNLQGGENMLAGALSRLNMVVEQYPDLKANENMAQLSEEMTSTENRIAFARQAFNDSVMAFNTYRQSFPPVAVAGMFGFGQDATLLQFEDAEQIQHAPQVSFQ